MYICFDLDDTLLSRKKKNKLTKYTIKVLEEAKKQGHILIANTARSLETARKYLDVIRPHYSVLNAGSLIVDKEYNVIYEKPMDKNITKLIIKDLIDLGYVFSVQTKDSLLTNIVNGYGKQFDFLNEFELEAFKIIPKNIEVRDAEVIKEKYDVDFTLYLSGVWSRFNHKEANKLTGLEYVVTKILKGKMEQTISFGDDYGDLPMLLGSGIGVAVANSVKEVKKKCLYHTESCERNGVAKFLIRYLNLEI